MYNRVKKISVKSFYVFIDICLSYMCIYLACVIRQKSFTFDVSFNRLLLGVENPFRAIFIFWILLVIVFANINRLYQTRRDIFEGFEVWLVLKAVIFSAIFAIVAVYALKIEGLPRSVILAGSILMMFALSIWRIVKRFLVEYLVAHGYNNINVLIVGSGKVGNALAQEIKKRPSLGLKIVGFLDDYKNLEKENVLGKLSEFQAIAQRKFIDQIFITIHHDSNVFLKLLEEAKELGVAVRVVPQGFGLTSGDFFRYNIGLIPILEYSDINRERKQVGKRIFDLLISLLVFILLLPFFIILSLVICLDSRGRPFYSSKRYGRSGKVFNMYKFRSMKKDADKDIEQFRQSNEADGPIFKIRKDPRITNIGRFLRRYSLDELPQIINVLKGEMSLVGPRPLPIEQIEKEDLRQLKRLGVRPGITGLWQIRGRSDISFQRLIKWDIWYIKNWSFWLDFNILLQTIPVVLKGKGAY